jgi:Cu(I)/Ag(I) efflux system membrane fusion protein
MGGMKPSGSSDKMDSQNNENYESAKILSVKEGQYVMMGETVLNVISNENTAVIIQVRSEDMSKIKIGSEAEVTIEEGSVMNGKVEFIEPILRSGTKTVSAKIYFNNTKANFKIGSLVTAKIKSDEFEALWIPTSALVNLGNEKVVWISKNGYFISKKIETGARSGNMIEIADGLTEDDVIAQEAHYLTDSEGFINAEENEK